MGANLGCFVILSSPVQNVQARGYLPPKLTFQSDNTSDVFKNTVTLDFFDGGIFEEVSSSCMKRIRACDRAGPVGELGHTPTSPNHAQRRLTTSPPSTPSLLPTRLRKLSGYTCARRFALYFPLLSNFRKTFLATCGEFSYIPKKSTKCSQCLSGHRHLEPSLILQILFSCQPIGHTHSDVDASFGTIANHLRTTDAMTLDG